MRSEVESILLAKDHIYFDLPLAARLLLVTDGTVTELLEAMLKERIKIGYKKQYFDKVENHPGIPGDHSSANCLHRAITLRGAATNTDWLYAESIVSHQLLSPAAQDMLVQGKIPIGTILNDQAPDNHREIIDCGVAPNYAAATLLNLCPEHRFVYRSYHVLAGIDPVMNITEWFPVERITKGISRFG